MAMTTIPALIEAIQATQARYIAGDLAAGADLHGYRMQLLRAIHASPAWRCVLCHQSSAPCRYDAAICAACDKALAKRGERRCKECGAAKALTKFQAVRPGVRRRTCVACWKKHMAPETRARHNAWRRRHRNAAAESAYRKAWIRANPEKRREQQRRYNARNAAKIAARQRVWQQRNPEKVRASQARYRQRRKARIWFGGKSQ
jgi:hypothetical protein